MSHKVHFKLKNQSTKGEKDVIKENISQMKLKRRGLKGGPMRGPRAHHPVHGHLHGLTRQGMESAEIFKGFSSGGSTFTYPCISFINPESCVYGASPEREAGDDMMIEKNTVRNYGKERSPYSRESENERKLNIGRRAYGRNDKYMLVRGAYLRKGEFGKPPITYNFLMLKDRKRRFVF